MDSVRPVLRVAVVVVSLSLMIAYVWYTGSRPHEGWTAPASSGKSPATSPAEVSNMTVVPGTLIFGSKSGAVVVDLPPGTLNTPATHPSVIFSTSKSIILKPLDPPATRPGN